MTKRTSIRTRGGRSSHLTKRRGVVLVWVAVLMVVLVGVTGLAIDVGYTMLVRHQLQNAADAAALAGAHEVLLDETGQQARTAASSIGSLNYAHGTAVSFDLDGGDVIVGRYDTASRIFLPNAEYPNAVRATARLTSGSPNGALPLFFGPMFGVTSVDVQRTALAVKRFTPGYAWSVLDSDAPEAVKFSGTTTFESIHGGGVVNSSAGSAFHARGRPKIRTPQVDLVGGNVIRGAVDFDPSRLHPIDAPVADPLGDVPEPDLDALLSQGLQDEGSLWLNDQASVTISPTSGTSDGYHYFSGGIRMQGGTLTLTPGIYILDGEGLSMTGGNLIANGVMLHIVGSGRIDLGGNGNIELSPPTLPAEDAGRYFPAADTYRGISIWQARDNHNGARMVGTHDTKLTGTLYLPGAELWARGTSFNMGNQIIVNTLDINGTGDITIPYRGRDDVLAHVSYLVE